MRRLHRLRSVSGVFDDSAQASSARSESTDVVQRIAKPGCMYHILLVSTDVSDGTDVVESWRSTHSSVSLQHCDLLHFSFSALPEALALLDLLDKVRPPASSWSRVRHLQDGGQTPMRSRAEPLGLLLLRSAASLKQSCQRWQRKHCLAPQ